MQDETRSRFFDACVVRGPSRRGLIVLGDTGQGLQGVAQGAHGEQSAQSASKSASKSTYNGKYGIPISQPLANYLTMAPGPSSRHAAAVVFIHSYHTKACTTSLVTYEPLTQMQAKISHHKPGRYCRPLSAARLAPSLIACVPFTSAHSHYDHLSLVTQHLSPDT